MQERLPSLHYLYCWICRLLLIRSTNRSSCQPYWERASQELHSSGATGLSSWTNSLFCLHGFTRFCHSETWLFISLLCWWNSTLPLISSSWSDDSCSHLSMFSDHITKTARSCRFALYNIKKIRPFLSEHATQLLVQALVLSRLDYCNALLAGLPASSIKHLQLIQNAAARLIFNEPKTTHVTFLFINLHWLPIAAHIKFKALMFAFVYSAHMAIAHQNWRGVWLYNSPPNTVSKISSKEATERAVHSTARNSGNRGYESKCAERQDWNARSASNQPCWAQRQCGISPSVTHTQCECHQRAGDSCMSYNDCAAFATTLHWNLLF